MPIKGVGLFAGLFSQAYHNTVESRQELGIYILKKREANSYPVACLVCPFLGV